VTRILVVDDDRGIRQLLVEVLKAEGYVVETAKNGRDALVSVREQQPDVIVTDLMMPLMDGWTFIRECRRAPGSELIPILVMSAHVQVAEMVRDLGVQSFISKPFDLDVMLRALEQAIRIA
jgi:CheY-like chemotaxis protein